DISVSRTSSIFAQEPGMPSLVKNLREMGTDICVPNPASHNPFPHVLRGHSCLSPFRLSPFRRGMGIHACALLLIFFPARPTTSTAAPIPLPVRFADLPNNSGPCPQSLPSVGFHKQFPATAGIL